ncbi:MAG: hypothetical protein Q7S29_01495 [Candidatus Peribacter sp.]|nr:hypothetical protein [Candidatus Peribacter sp.]
MHSTDIQEFLTVATAAVEAGTGPLSKENEERAKRVARAYFELQQGNLTGLAQVTLEIARLKERDQAPKSAQALKVIAETLRFCREVLPPRPDYEEAA